MEKNYIEDIKECFELCKNSKINDAFIKLREVESAIFNSSSNSDASLIGTINSIKRNYKLNNKISRPIGCEVDSPFELGKSFSFGNKVSIVTACKDRNFFLKKVLPSWMQDSFVDEIIIVDWCSSDPIYAFLKFYGLLHEKIKIVRVTDASKWNLAEAFNLAVNFASNQIFAKIDCDVLIGKNLFSRNKFTRGNFFVGSVSQLDETKYTNGTFIGNKFDFYSVNGYSESISQYGWDDDDLYSRLEANGVVKNYLDGEYFTHINHSDKIRVELYNATSFAKSIEGSVDYKIIYNKNLIRSANENKFKNKYFVTYQAERYLEVCSDRSKEFVSVDFYENVHQLAYQEWIFNFYKINLNLEDASKFSIFCKKLKSSEVTFESVNDAVKLFREISGKGVVHFALPRSPLTVSNDFIAKMKSMYSNDFVLVFSIDNKEINTSGLNFNFLKYEVFNWNDGGIRNTDLNSYSKFLLELEHLNADERIGQKLISKEIFNNSYDLLDFSGVDNEVKLVESLVLDYISTRVFDRNIAFIDLLGMNGVATLGLTKLFPSAKFINVYKEGDSSKINLINNLDPLRFRNYKDNCLTESNLYEIDGFLSYLDGAVEVCILHGNEFESLIVESFISSLKSLFKVNLFSVNGAEFIRANIRNMTIHDGPWVASSYSHGAYHSYEKKLDVVVAMYNTPTYIEECVNSLLQSEVANVIVVNDGSTDDSAAIVNKAFENNPRVKLVSKINGGCASARNFGRELSNASHIAFMDADDFVDPKMFDHLFDLSMSTGAEIVQSGFDFFDAEKGFYNSYEDDVFSAYPITKFNGQDVIRLPSIELIQGQPSIWRRIYRRDFLDNKKLNFPENIRAFDDYIFQMLSLYYARDVYMLPKIKLHYRQHPSQDIKQGDERHFYEIYMFKLLLKRSIEEGWPDIKPFVNSIKNTIKWSLSSLKKDLIDQFAKSSALLFLITTKVYGDEVIGEDICSDISSESFNLWWQYFLSKSDLFNHSYVWSYIERIEDQPSTLNMFNALKVA